MICNNCGNEISDDSKFCYKCGNKTTKKHNNKLKHTQKICNRCGSKISSDAEVCNKCGNRINNTGSNGVDVDTAEHNTQNSNISEVDNSHIQSAEQETYNSQNSTPPVKTNKSLSNNKIILMCTIFLIFVTLVALLTPDTNTQIDTSLDTNNTANTAEIQLTKTYTNDEEGISFNYPDNWIENIVGESANNCFIFLGEVEGEYFNSCMLISQKQVDKNFTIDSIKPKISKSIEDRDYEVQEIIDTKIDGIDAFKATAILANDFNSITYYYTSNEKFYQITFFISTDLYDTYAPIIDEIMESYKITTPIESTTQDYGLSKEEAVAVAGEYMDTHPLYNQVVTGEVEYEPDNYPYSTKGLYLVVLIDSEGERRPIWVDKRTGSIYVTKDGTTLSKVEDFSKQTNPSNQESSDVVLYKGLNVSDYLGSNLDSIYADFGNPTAGTPLDGSYSNDSKYIDYDGIKFLYNNSSTVTSITGNPEMFTYNGVTLDKNRDELINLLGTPLLTFTSTNDMSSKKTDWIQYRKNNCSIKFGFDDKISDASSISFFE